MLGIHLMMGELMYVLGFGAFADVYPFAMGYSHSPRSTVPFARSMLAVMKVISTCACNSFQAFE